MESVRLQMIPKENPGEAAPVSSSCRGYALSKSFFIRLYPLLRRLFFAEPFAAVFAFKGQEEGEITR